MNIYLLYQGEGIQIKTLPCCTVDNKIEMLKTLSIFWNPFLYNCGKNFDNHVNFLKSHEISWYLCDMSIYEMLMSVKYEILYVVCSAVIIGQPPLPNLGIFLCSWYNSWSKFSYNEFNIYISRIFFEIFISSLIFHEMWISSLHG